MHTNNNRQPLTHQSLCSWCRVFARIGVMMAYMGSANAMVLVLYFIGRYVDEIAAPRLSGATVADLDAFAHDVDGAAADSDADSMQDEDEASDAIEEVMTGILGAEALVRHYHAAFQNQSYRNDIMLR